MSCSPKAISRATASQVLMRTTGGTMRGIEKFRNLWNLTSRILESDTRESRMMRTWNLSNQDGEVLFPITCNISIPSIFDQLRPFFWPFLTGVVSCCCSKCGNNNWTSGQGMIKSCWLVDQRLPRVSVHFLTSLVVQDYSHQSFCMSDMSVCLQLFQKAKKASEIKLKVPSTASPSETTPG